MNNIQIVTDELTGIEHIIIVNKDNSQITMPKSTYDAQQEHLTENPTA
jgi:hypothetical protein